MSRDRGLEAALEVIEGLIDNECAMLDIEHGEGEPGCQERQKELRMAWAAVTSRLCLWAPARTSWSYGPNGEYL